MLVILYTIIRMDLKQKSPKPWGRNLGLSIFGTRFMKPNQCLCLLILRPHAIIAQM